MASKDDMLATAPRWTTAPRGLDDGSMLALKVHNSKEKYVFVQTFLFKSTKGQSRTVKSTRRTVECGQCAHVKERPYGLFKVRN